MFATLCVRAPIYPTTAQCHSVVGRCADGGSLTFFEGCKIIHSLASCITFSPSGFGMEMGDSKDGSGLFLFRRWLMRDEILCLCLARTEGVIGEDGG